MNYLEAMEMILYMLQSIQAGKRVQIPKSKLAEVKSSLSQLITILGNENDDLRVRMILEDLFRAVTAAEETSITFLPDSMKNAIEDALTRLKYEVAALTFKHFTFHDFEATDEIIPLMREVVACHYGGAKVD